MTDTPQDRPHDGSPALRLRFAALSDVGRHRKDNQDSGYASERLLVVADGVGGAAFGDVASSTAVQLLRKLDDEPTDEMLPLLAGAVHRVHDRLAELVENDKELDGTSTTVTAAMFDGQPARLRPRRRQPRLPAARRRAAAAHRTTTPSSRPSSTRAGSPRPRPRSTPTATSSCGPSTACTTPSPTCSTSPSSPATGSCCAPTAAPAASTTPASRGCWARATSTRPRSRWCRPRSTAGSTDNVTVVVAEVVAADAPDDPDLAGATTGPMLVGAAAAQPRRGAGAAGAGRGMFRRQSDTDEIDPVPARPPTEPVDPEELRYAPRPPDRFLAVCGGWPSCSSRSSCWPAAIVFGYVWSQNQYYVAADGDQVAIYQGVQMDLPLVEPVLGPPGQRRRRRRAALLRPGAGAGRHRGRRPRPRPSAS